MKGICYNILIIEIESRDDFMHNNRKQYVIIALIMKIDNNYVISKYAQWINRF